MSTRLTPLPVATIVCESFDRTRERGWPLIAYLAGSAVMLDVAALSLVLLVAGGARIAWWLLELPPFLDQDSVGYFIPGFDLATGLGLTIGIRRTPGYSLLAAGVLTSSGFGSLYPLLAIQQLLGLTTAGLTYLLGRLLFDRVTALMAGLLVGLDGALLLFGQEVMSESLFAFLLVLSCLLAVLGLRSRPTALIPAGLSFGLLALVRPIGMVLLLPVLLAAALAGPRPRWRSVGWLAAGVVLVISPWMVRNTVQFGTPALAGSGRFLAARALKYDDLFDRWAASGGAAKLGNDPLRRDAFAILLEEDRKAEPGSVTKRFRGQLGLDEQQSDRLLRDLSIRVIRADFGHYLQSTGWIAVQLIVNRPLDIAEYWRPYADVGWPVRASGLLPASPDLSRLPAAQALIGVVDPGRAGPLLAVLFGVGSIVAWRLACSRLWLVAVGVTVVGILCTAAIGGLEWRYRFGFDPLLLLGGSAGLSCLVSYAWRRVSRGSESPARLARA